MKNLYTFLFLVCATIVSAQTNVGITGNVSGVYINEFHYDNINADTGEFIEVAGPSGTDLSNYTITLYNGNDNTFYDAIHLSGIIDDEGTGVGTVSFSATGIQNGTPDGIALSKTGNTNIQYLSYEGVMTGLAVEGSAMGLNSVDILVSETGTTPIGYSLEYDETSMSWIVSSDDTPGDFAQGTSLFTINNEFKKTKIYPNPLSNGILFIESNAASEKTISVFDVLGKQIAERITSENKINLHQLNKGVYLVKVSAGEEMLIEKLIVE